MLKLSSLLKSPKSSLSFTSKYQILNKFSPNSQVPSPQTRNILITAALPYVNNTPHLGNIIGGILSADCYTRYCRMRGYNTLFVSGTDQYGTTTQVKAKQQNTSPQNICDKYHKIHKDIYDWFNIQFDYFGRTSNPIHSQITTQIFKHVHTNNYIKTNTIQQLYCNKCKISLADRYIKGICKNCGSSAKGDQCDSCNTVYKDPIKQLLQPKCKICQSTPIVKNSEHLYFRLSQCVGILDRWLIDKQNNKQKDSQKQKQKDSQKHKQGNGMKLWSNNAKAVTKAWLNTGLQDRCITRDLNWGVPVSEQYLKGNKVFYVWFEAPIGYISITAGGIQQKWRKWWIPSQNTKVQLNQFMGKDNIAFHSILAPATLHCTGQPYIKPTRLSVTQYLMYEGGKFSKSNNTGIFGNDCQNTGIKSDIWRYVLLINRPQVYDTQFTLQQLAVRNKSDLLNTIGNMCNRILKYIYSNLKNQIPLLDINKYNEIDKKVIQDFTKLIKKYCESMQNVQLKSGCQCILEMGQLINKYLQDTQFWNKNNVKQGRNIIVMSIAVRILEYYAIIIRPYLPQTSDKIIYILSLNSQNIVKFNKHIEPYNQFKQSMLNLETITKQNQKWKNIKLNKPQILFTQIQDKKIKELSIIYGSISSAQAKKTK